MRLRGMGVCSHVSWILDPSPVPSSAVLSFILLVVRARPTQSSQFLFFIPLRVAFFSLTESANGSQSPVRPLTYLIRMPVTPDAEDLSFAGGCPVNQPCREKNPSNKWENLYDFIEFDKTGIDRSLFIRRIVSRPGLSACPCSPSACRGWGWGWTGR